MNQKTSNEFFQYSWSNPHSKKINEIPHPTNFLFIRSNITNKQWTWFHSEVFCLLFCGSAFFRGNRFSASSIYFIHNFYMYSWDFVPKKKFFICTIYYIVWIFNVNMADEKLQQVQLFGEVLAGDFEGVSRGSFDRLYCLSIVEFKILER